MIIQKALKLRNPWGNNAGENGNYYMTYQYYEAMIEDVSIIY